VDGLREQEEKVSVYGLKEAPDWSDDETFAYKEKPLIMIRIVHLQELFSKMKIPSECEIHCSFAVIDPILHKNSRIWKLSSSKGEESLSVSETEDSQGVLSIAALTEILFGYKTPEEIRAEKSVILTEELEEELRKLQNFCPIFLNEIV
jgi:predicted acetyltransferase